MRTSEAGIRLIADYEGYSAKAYPDPATGAEPYTIGFGTTVYPDGRLVKPGDTCTREQAEEWLRHHIAKAERYLEPSIRVPITQGQYDAILSLAYNVGARAVEKSTLLRLLNEGKPLQAADEFLKWNMAGGKVLPGLSLRRGRERAMFLSGESTIQTGRYPPTPTKPEQPMAPFLAAALPALIQSIPALAKLFGSGSQVSERNIKVAETVAQIVTEATGAPNVQAAVETIQTDPAALQKAAKAVEERFYELQQVGGGIEAARKADADFQREGVFYKSPAFVVTCLLVPLVYLTVGAVLFGSDWTSETRAMVVAAIISGVLGAITGYFLGTSISSQRKTELLNPK